MQDKLVIKDLVVEAVVGVSEWEQEKPQPIWIDLELAIDARQAATRDDVKDAVDYGALVTAVKTQVEGRVYRLLETMAEDVAAVILKEFRVPEALVRVKKRVLPGVDYAAVEVRRRAG